MPANLYHAIRKDFIISVVSMLPCKVFLEAIRGGELKAGTLKTQLTLNGLYYDEIKQFHSKYLCLTAKDQLSIELIRTDSGELLGSVHLVEAYKLALQKQTINLHMGQHANDPTLVLSFEPVVALQRSASPVKVPLPEELTHSPVREASPLFTVTSPRPDGPFPQSPQQISLFESERRDALAETSRLLKSKIEEMVAGEN